MGRVYREDTIAAIATPLGEGAIGVVRVSGGESITAIGKLFSGSIHLCEVSTHTVHYGRLVDASGDAIDEVLVTVFKAPRSYTGEDSVEISCHGGLYVTRKVLATVLATGVRQAEPGEFTKRAFLNGKLDLSQAEAVADLIASKSDVAYRFSMNQLEGRFSEKIKLLRSEILNLTSLLELELDFSEDGIDLLPKTEIVRRASLVIDQINVMADSYRLGKVYREGISVAIVGKPNAGKSSIFNALLKENRAIVTEIPGTTRDSLEETLSIDGVHFKLNDTAGLRASSDLIEQEGISRTRQLLRTSDITMLVVDATQDDTGREENSLVDYQSTGAVHLVVYNKVDLLPDPNTLLPASSAGNAVVTTSAKSGFGIGKLRLELGRLASKISGPDRSILVTSARHHALLLPAKGALERAIATPNQGLTSEFVAFETRSAADALSEVVGEITSEDTLNNIFQSFCIGK